MMIRRTRLGAPLAFMLLAAACTSAATTGSPVPSPPAPSPASPAPSPSPAVSALPSPTPPAATVIDPVLVLRADAIGDVVAGRVPGLSIYQDGTVLLRGDPGPVVARLTPEGLSTLMEETIASPAVSGGDIGPAPDYAAGFTWYFIAIRDLDRLIERSVSNAAPADRKAEADAVIALVDRLLGLETWLPEAAWVVAPAVAEPWVPARYLLKVTDWGYTGDLALPVDLIDIEWPLAEALLAFGEPFDIGSSPGDAGGPREVRCGVVTLEEALAVQAAFRVALAGGELNLPGPERLDVELAWAEGDSELAVSLVFQLPDDPPDCSLDKSWP